MTEMIPGVLPDPREVVSRELQRWAGRVPLMSELEAASARIRETLKPKSLDVHIVYRQRKPAAVTCTVVIESLPITVTQEIT